jgi:hypothetical protein
MITPTDKMTLFSGAHHRERDAPAPPSRDDWFQSYKLHPLKDVAVLDRGGAKGFVHYLQELVIYDAAIRHD